MNKTRKNKKKSLKYLGKILKKKAGSSNEDFELPPGGLFSGLDLGIDDTTFGQDYMNEDDKRERDLLFQFTSPDTEKSFAAINDSEIEKTVVKDNRVTPSPKINERVIVDEQKDDEKVTHYRPQNLEECLRSDNWNVYEKWIFENINNPYPTQEVKDKLQKIAKKDNIHIDPNHWFSNTRKRIILPLKRGEKLSSQKHFYKKNWKFIIQLDHFIDINEIREEEQIQRQTRTRKRKDRKGGK